MKKSEIRMSKSEANSKSEMHRAISSPGSDFSLADVPGLPAEDSECFRQEVIRWLQSVDGNGRCEGVRHLFRHRYETYLLLPKKVPDPLAVEIAAGWARDVVADSTHRDAHRRLGDVGRFRPLAWTSAYPERYLRFWQEVQRLLHDWLVAGMPEEWPPAADEFVVVGQ